MSSSRTLLPTNKAKDDHGWSHTNYSSTFLPSSHKEEVAAILVNNCIPNEPRQQFARLDIAAARADVAAAGCDVTVAR